MCPAGDAGGPPAPRQGDDGLLVGHGGSDAVVEAGAVGEEVEADFASGGVKPGLGFTQSGGPAGEGGFSNDLKIFFQWLEKIGRIFK